MKDFNPQPYNPMVKIISDIAANQLELTKRLLALEEEVGKLKAPQ